jgi:hypothetical protein
MKLYRTLVRPVVTYRGETRILNSADENSLRILERKILRGNMAWFVRTVNGELGQTKTLIISVKVKIS